MYSYYYIFMTAQRIFALRQTYIMVILVCDVTAHLVKFAAICPHRYFLRISTSIVLVIQVTGTIPRT